MADTSIKQYPAGVVGDVLDYSINWILDPSDTIATATFSISPAATVTPALIVGNVSTTFVSGMQAQTIYSLSCTIVTTEGRTAKRSGVIECLAVA